MFCGEDIRVDGMLVDARIATRNELKGIRRFAGHRAKAVRFGGLGDLELVFLTRLKARQLAAKYFQVGVDVGFGDGFGHLPDGRFQLRVMDR